MKTKNILIILGIFVAVVLLVVGSLVLFRPDVIPFLATPELNDYECLGGGLNVYSFSRVNYIDYDSLIGDDVWKVTIAPYTGSQCLIGQFEAEDVIDGTKQAEYDFSIDAETSPQVCLYDIGRTGENVLKLEVGSESTWYPWKIDDIAETCKSKAITLGNDRQAIIWSTGGDTWFSTSQPPILAVPPYKCYYYSEENSYNIGNIIFDTLSFNTRIILNARGKIYDGIITNTQYTEGETGKIPSGKQFWLGPEEEVRAEFEGILSTGTRCPTVRELYGRAANVNYAWRIIDEDNLENYDTYYDAGMWTCISQSRSSSALSSCKITFNNKAEWALNPKTISYKGATAKVLGSKVKFVYDSLSISYPTIGLRVKADILGVATRGGEPEITGKSTQCFTEGYDGFLTFQVRNKGDYLGNFYSYTTCPSPIHVITQPSMKISSRTVKTFTVNIKSDEVDKQTIKTCTFKVWDDETGKEASTTIEACVNRATRPCTQGDKRCNLPDRKEIEICTIGGEWDTLEICGNDEVCVENGVPKCLACIGKGETIITGFECCFGLVREGNVCKAKPGWWDNLYFLPILLALGLSALMGWKEREKTGKYRPMPFIIWGVLGAIIGIIAVWVIQNWLMITLITLFGGGLSLALILAIGGIPLLLVIISMFRRK